MSNHRTCRFLQHNQDRRLIFALVTGGGPALGHGPLTLEEIYHSLYLEPYPRPWHPRGDAALAEDLLARAEEFHDLADFYRFYRYPADLIEWVEASPAVDGRDAAEVAERLRVEPAMLREAALTEAVILDAFDPAGDPLYQAGFTTNWAIADAAGRISINPDAYRFKAWLSLEAGDHDGST